MFSQQQCEIARTLTKDDALNEQINSEYQTMTPTDKSNAAAQIDKLCKEHNDSFDKAFPVIANDFKVIANTYHISQATLFCVYMESKQ